MIRRRMKTNNELQEIIDKCPKCKMDEGLVATCGEHRWIALHFTLQATANPDKIYGVEVYMTQKEE